MSFFMYNRHKKVCHIKEKDEEHRRNIGNEIHRNKYKQKTVRRRIYSV